MGQEIAVREVLDELVNKLIGLQKIEEEFSYAEVNAKEVSKEKCKILNELLVFRIAGIVGRLEVKRKRDDLGDCSENFCEHLNQLLIVRIVLASL